MLTTGIKGKLRITVNEKNTAASFESGLLPVFATPAMIALMEKTSYTSVESELGEGMSTVGTSVEIKHISATPVGMDVTCESELVEIDGRRLVFTVKAYDECGLIGEGTHERFIINSEKYLSKTNAKKA